MNESPQSRQTIEAAFHELEKETAASRPGPEIGNAEDDFLLAVGPVVLDIHVVGLGPDRRSAKRICLIREAIGGGALHVSRSAADHGCNVQPYLLVGQDRVGDLAITELCAEFPAARFDPAYEETRRSIFPPDGVCYTTRPKCLRDDLLDPSLRGCLAKAKVTIVAPFVAEDYDYVSAILSGASRSVLMLSDDQMQHPESALRLMKQATVAVFNDAEAERLTGHRDPREAVKHCRELGCDVIVTHRGGAIAWIDGAWSSARAIKVKHVRQETGAGDVFTAVFAAAWAMDCSVGNSLALGQAAAARHVAYRKPLKSLSALSVWAETQPRVSVKTTVTPRFKEFNVRRAVVTGVAASVLVVLLSVLFT